MAFLKSFAIFILASGGMSAGILFRMCFSGIYPERKELTVGRIGVNKNGYSFISASISAQWQLLHVANEEIGASSICIYVQLHDSIYDPTYIHNNLPRRLHSGTTSNTSHI